MRALFVHAYKKTERKAQNKEKKKKSDNFECGSKIGKEKIENESFKTFLIQFLKNLLQFFFF